MTVRTLDRLKARLSNSRHGNAAQDLRDMLVSLWPVIDSVIGDGSTGISTTSTSYVDVADMTLDVAAEVDDLLEIHFVCNAYNSSTGDFIFITANVAGTKIDPTGGHGSLGGGVDTMISVLAHHVVVADDITDGTVTVKIQWLQGGGGTATMSNSSSGRRPLLVVKNHRRAS